MEAEAEAQGGPDPMDVEPPQPPASSLGGPPTIATEALAPASSADPQDIKPPERPSIPSHATPDNVQAPIPSLARASLEVLQDINPPERIPQPSHATPIGSQAPNTPPLEPPLDQTSELVPASVTEPAPPRIPSIDFGKSSIFRVDQSTSAWQTAKDALEAGMNGLSSISHSQRTGGRRGRGPRRHLSPVPSGSITLKPHDNMPTFAPPPTTPRRGSGTRRGRGGGRGRGRKSFSGTKRKRGTDSDDEHDNGTSSSEEITALPSQSRSGRKITQAHQSSNVKLDLEDEDELEEESPMPAPRRNASFSTNAPAPSPAAPRPPLYKPAPKKVKRTPGQSAVCKNCSRGPSPASNAIVFCDGCNTPWHQHCHEPPIRQEFLLEVDRDWFCADCVLLREHSVMLEGKVAGHGMSMLEKRKYLKSLPPSTLVALLLHASSIYPNLPIFPPKPTVVNVDIATLDADDQGLYEEVIDELPYPKAGHGIQLRPESEDVSILVDDNIAVYSHCWKGIAEMMAEGGWSRKGGGVRTVNGLGIKAGA